MPLVPERLRSRQDVKAAISSQFWEQPVHSTRSIDGLVWALPCEPPALNLTGSSGLSRTQQLLAAQALGVPALPSYDGNSQGLVLDRVLARLGGRRWWTSLGGRIKAQRMYKQASGGRSKVQAFRDLENYALCARGRFQLARRLTLNGIVEAPDAATLRRRLRRLRAGNDPGSATAAGGSGSSSTSSDLAAAEGAAGDAASDVLEDCSGHAILRMALPLHDLTASVGYNLEYADSAGDYAHVPLAVALDLSSQDRGDGLQYRVGLYQATAPLTESDANGRQQRMRTALHVQGSVAVEGEAHIWRGGGGNGGAASGTAAGGAEAPAAAASKQQAAGGSSSGGAAVEELPSTKIGSALSAAAAAEEAHAAALWQVGSGPSSTGAADAAGRQPEPSAEPSSGGSLGDAAGTAPAPAAGVCSDGEQQEQQQDGGLPASLEQFIRPLEQLTGQVSGIIHHYTHPEPASGSEEEQPGSKQQRGAAAADAGGSGSERGEVAMLPSPARLLGMSAESLSAAIHDSVALLQQLRGSVERITSDVQDGSLQRLTQQLADTRRQPTRRRPYSMLLAQPHLKLNAAMGCLARAPLPSVRALSFPQALSGPLGASDRLANASTSSLVSHASYSSQLAEAWRPYLKDTSLRVFASLGLSGQLGRFTRPFLDYTAASARIDLGLTSQHVVGMVPPSMLGDESHRPDKHRAFALEGRGAWHALSLSLAQQIVGPVRVRLDARFALDPTNVPANEGERSTLKGLAQTALSVRPGLLEAVLGCDVVLPGTEGVGRLALWYSPKRREAMAELRLF